jgi:hypothetical protein
MKPEQALDLLYRAARMAHLPAADHDACREAAMLLAKAIQPAAESPPANVETKPDPPDCSTL